MDMDAQKVSEDFRKLLEEQRCQCLWFAREDYVPTAPADMLRVLDQIQRNGNLDAFRRAGAIKRWLLRNSSGVSAV